MSDKIAAYTQAVKEKLSPERFAHSLNVAETAKNLSIKYGYLSEHVNSFDVFAEKAFTAGLLHDIMKDIPKTEQLEIISGGGVALSALELALPKLWHAIAGEIYARDFLFVRDSEILSAIRCHTTAKSGMTLLEKVLYIADFISADRVYDGVGRMREKAARDLDEAMEEGLAFSIEELIKKLFPIHPDTISAYNEIIMPARQS
ncbi:MAG: bis(5'-nucleosyl)-tetraphosphatase (symmetrical) YqeK [Oscillospiraceae bacterium]|nr:bis(5'-nucleosyl)-tetraphosphatase (symmetrical) YqeK [Oscillospiraceae bacterium]